MTKLLGGYDAPISRPILFSAPMVNQLLIDAKTQTRRLIQLRGEELGSRDRWLVTTTGRIGRAIHCPYGKPGDTLWVRETFVTFKEKDWIGYPADGAMLRWRDGNVIARDAMVQVPKKTPSIYMRRWMSRLQLEVTAVRAERLLDITESDAKAEGARRFFEMYPGIGRDQRITSGELASDGEYRAGFACLWDDINADRATWKSNPWVWVVTFRRTGATDNG